LSEKVETVMMTFLLDTNHASEIYKGGKPIITRAVASNGKLALCRTSVAELWYMVYNSGRIAANKTRLDTILAAFECLEFSQAAAEQFGKSKADLRAKGTPIPDPDVQIAAIAIVNRMVLLTDDQHFGNVAGLAVDNWIRQD
jgi:tRNA(fMet)-specific endonuclease VapC